MEARPGEVVVKCLKQHIMSGKRHETQCIAVVVDTLQIEGVPHHECFEKALVDPITKADHHLQVSREVSGMGVPDKRRRLAQQEHTSHRSVKFV